MDEAALHSYISQSRSWNKSFLSAYHNIITVLSVCTQTHTHMLNIEVDSNYFLCCLCAKHLQLMVCSCIARSLSPLMCHTKFSLTTSTVQSFLTQVTRGCAVLYRNVVIKARLEYLCLPLVYHQGGKCEQDTSCSRDQLLHLLTISLIYVSQVFLLQH